MRIRKILISRKLHLVSAFAAAALALGTASAARAGSLGDFFSSNGKKVSHVYTLNGFDQIETTGVYDLKISVGGKFAVQLIGSETELENVNVRVKDGRLVLDQHKDTNWLGFHRHGITATISLPKLSALDMTGVGDANVTGLAADSFSADMSGIGDVTLSGTCKELTAHVSGIGDFDSRKLNCKTAKVHVSGIGDVSVYASLLAAVKSSGIGDVDIYGSPKVVVKDGHLLTDIKVH